MELQKQGEPKNRAFVFRGHRLRSAAWRSLLHFTHLLSPSGCDRKRPRRLRDSPNHYWTRDRYSSGLANSGGGINYCRGLKVLIFSQRRAALRTRDAASRATVQKRIASSERIVSLKPIFVCCCLATSGFSRINRAIMSSLIKEGKGRGIAKNVQKTEERRLESLSDSGSRFLSALWGGGVAGGSLGIDSDLAWPGSPPLGRYNGARLSL